MVSWTLNISLTPAGVIIKGGGFQARANLNGGELGKEPSPSMEKSIIRKIGVKGGLLEKI